MPQLQKNRITNEKTEKVLLISFLGILKPIKFNKESQNYK
jgi:hypothetical protein